MCGIVGKISFCKIDSTLADSMLQKIDHRGPDYTGKFIEGNCFLGHKRLSIIDLSATGHQPMLTVDGRYVLVYNGELYNYKEIKQKLIEVGIEHFRGHSDTEVMLYALATWQEKALPMFNGMFAFAFFDRQKKTLLLARDRMGIKPLYYSQKGASFWFASEIKALTVDPEFDRSLSLRGIENFFSYGHACCPDTIFESCWKLQPSFFLKYSEEMCEIASFWEPVVPTKNGSYTGSYEQACGELHDRMTKAVERQLIADVPVGVFLSGGIDSSIIAALTKEIKGNVDTFSLGFDNLGNSYNELAAAEAVADHISSDHHHFLANEQNLIDLLESIAYQYDEPFGDAAALPVMLLSKFTREYVKVALSGEGADELFYGYRRYVVENITEKLSSIIVADHVKHLRGLWSSLPRMRRTKIVLDSFTFNSPIARYNSHLMTFSNNRLSKLLNPDIIERIENSPAMIDHAPFNTTVPPDLCAYLDQVFWLPNTYLEKTDKASMAYSLEVRVPFLDNEIVAFANSLPTSYKLFGFQKKRVLKDAFRTYLPSAILKRPKHGFSVPLDPWFRGKLKGYLLDLINSGANKYSEYLNQSEVEKIADKHINGREDYSSQLWLILVFESWLRDLDNDH